ncbi:hypothetical protein Pelo_18288 [Pelomyxa schiedti]|nr:hypothetical protein Pelo_18288 [Pelomyxa schiedti]
MGYPLPWVHCWTSAIAKFASVKVRSDMSASVDAPHACVISGISVFIACEGDAGVVGKTTEACPPSIDIALKRKPCRHRHSTVATFLRRGRVSSVSAEIYAATQQTRNPLPLLRLCLRGSASSSTSTHTSRAHKDVVKPLVLEVDSLRRSARQQVVSPIVNPTQIPASPAKEVPLPNDDAPLTPRNEQQDPFTPLGDEPKGPTTSTTTNTSTSSTPDHTPLMPTIPSVLVTMRRGRKTPQPGKP